MASRIYPVVFNWIEATLADGEVRFVMVPQPRYAKVAARQFHPNEDYPLVVLEARSRASHSHYFAALHDGFRTLPETIAARWPTEEHLRKWLLVETGWFDESEIDVGTARAAKEMGLYMRKRLDYTRISIHGSKIIMRDAKSQSAQAMGKESFEQSKKSVLDFLEHMIGVAKGTLKKEAGRSA